METNRTHIIRAFAVGVAIGALVVLAGCLTALALAPAPDLGQLPTLNACPTEDSLGCYWDADTQGNGLGHDVVTICQ